MYVSYVIRPTSNACHVRSKRCDLTTHANLDRLEIESFTVLLPVENMDTPNISRRALKPSEDKGDRLQCRREQEKARCVAETAEERQERLAKRREGDRARRSTEADNKSREWEKVRHLGETDKQKQERLKNRSRHSTQTANYEIDARLQLMRTRQSEWLAAETTTDRDARLQQMSTCQCEDWQLRLP